MGAYGKRLGARNRRQARLTNGLPLCRIGRTSRRRGVRMLGNGYPAGLARNGLMSGWAVPSSALQTRPETSGSAHHSLPRGGLILGGIRDWSPISHNC